MVSIVTPVFGSIRLSATEKTFTPNLLFEKWLEPDPIIRTNQTDFLIELIELDRT